MISKVIIIVSTFTT